MAPRVDPLVLRVLDGYQFNTRRVRAAVVNRASALWTDLGSWRDDDIARFAGQVTPVVKAGRRQMASLTDVYLATLARAKTGAGAPVGISDGVLDGIRNGTPLEEVYRRPGVTVWTAVSRGADWDAAVQQGLNRLTGMVATDMQLARTWAAREVFSRDDRVTGYRRVTSGLSCELCDLASDQTYSTEDLMPIHNNCSCDVEPIYAHEDSLGDLSTGSPDEDQGDKPVVHEHGELGPILAVAGQAFTGVDDLAA